MHGSGYLGFRHVKCRGSSDYERICPERVGCFDHVINVERIGHFYVRISCKRERKRICDI